MPAFLLSFLTVALAMFAGREAVRVARLSQGGMPLASLVGVAAVAAAIACAFAAWLAGTLSGLVPQDYHVWLVSAALVLAAVEVLLLSTPDTPREPTASLGATGIVLLAGILTDASALLIISLSLATGAPVLAAAGGALAAIGVLGFAAIAGEDWERMPRDVLRWVVAVALVAGALVLLLADPAMLG